ncbi:MAG TPA: EAL domain-containing protein [Candidatus Limnocylindria bacterium]|jgi:EAL domain-containing protein (putative c-di-GMP-specific phosphodiesterase class I)
MNTFTVQELRRAVEGDELVLLYHPQVDMRTGRAVAAEAGLRWRHPDRGLLHALAFVDAVPLAGLAPAYMEWILRTAARQMARWKAAGLRLERVTVNTWPENLGPQLADRAVAASVEARIAPSALEIEISPASRLDRTTLDCVRRIRAAGLRAALDDFGAGELRLAALRDTSFDTIKVPMAFVRDSHGPFSDAVIASAVSLSRALGAVVVAEGVETVAIRDRVLELGCDIGQGYLWSRIVPGDGFAQAIAAIGVDGVRVQ